VEDRGLRSGHEVIMSPNTINEIISASGFTQTDFLAYGIILSVPLVCGIIVVAVVLFIKKRRR
jgi:hypothetical protein